MYFNPIVDLYFFYYRVRAAIDKKEETICELQRNCDQGGFQLLDLIIKKLKSHMTCYNSMHRIG